MASGGAGSLNLRELFDRAVELSPDDLTKFLADLPPVVHDELTGLLDAHWGSTTFLSGTITNGLPFPAASGQRFGAFETQDLLGRGGMGSVFRARRVDGEVTQTVAVKVVDLGWLDPRVLERFRQERQFMAGLSHPNIARLIDGGTRADGVAYVAMEYVDGERIDRYCDSHGLGIKDRLRLMLPLCDAVEHAHSKLIIHRDLKPSNVLVGQDGQPKLLDFGVAKALDASAGSSTQTIALTPNFASPEQARGEPATTAADIYGLGALLYFLLTGRPPHQTEGLSTAAMQRVICEGLPPKLSSIRPELKGDLENILLRALHTEPARRYRSAREFAEDLERYLERRTVRATPDNSAYRLRRFVQRNAVATVAGALAVLAAGLGTGVSLYQAHRAQRRFAQVREMANKFLFEFESSIRTTPGTLDARRNMAATARQYLASLATDSGNDAGLQRELAESYYRLSDVESTARETDAELADLNRSRAILQGLHDPVNGAPAQRYLYVKVLVDLQHYWVDRDPKAAVPYSLECVQVADAFHRQYPQDALAWRAYLEAHTTRGVTISNFGTISDALEALAAAVRIGEEGHRKFPDDVQLTALLVDVKNRFGNVTNRSGRYQDGMQSLDEAIAIFDPLIASHPENPNWRDLRIKIAISRAATIRRLARTNPAMKPLALSAIRDVYQMARQNTGRNPGNVEALDVEYVVAARYANVLISENQLEAALALRQQAAENLKALEAAAPQDHRTLSLQLDNLLAEAGLANDLKRWRESEAALVAADAIMARIEAKWPDDPTTMDYHVSLFSRQTRLALRTGHTAQARRYCERGFQVALHLIRLAGQEKSEISMIDDLREDAKQLGVADPTLAGPTHQASALH